MNKTIQIRVGDVTIGGGAPIRVQSMTKTDTGDWRATLDQIKELAEAGCEIIRVAVPHHSVLSSFERIVGRSPIPVIADIHYDWRLAVEAARIGAHGLRINPGNIGEASKVEKIIKAAKDAGIPIRIGVNSGSLPRHILEKYGGATADGMVEAALEHIRFFEFLDFRTIKLSLKASDVQRTVEAYRKISKLVPYPLHVGITEAGTLLTGTVKSSVGIGILLSEGIGDTIRVSLAAPPVYEVKVGWEILKSLGLRKRGVELIACPTCGRLEVDLLPVVDEIERRLEKLDVPLKVAVMGCVVNGPGEAKEADIGLACGRGVGIIFERGKLVERVSEKEMVDRLLTRIYRMAEEYRKNEGNSG